MPASPLSVIFLVTPKYKKKLASINEKLSPLDQATDSFFLSRLTVDRELALNCIKINTSGPALNFYTGHLRQAGLIVVCKKDDEDITSISTQLQTLAPKKDPIVTTGEDGIWNTIASKLRGRANAKRPTISQFSISESQRETRAESRYGHFWQIKTSKQRRHSASLSDAKAIIREILADYSKYSCCGSWFSWLKRAATFHLNRHHVDAVSSIITRMDSGDLDSIDDILGELNAITKTHGYNQKGSLSMRITNIKAHLKKMNYHNAALIEDNAMTICPSPYTRY